MSHEAFTRKDGTICPVAYSAAPLQTGTSASGVVVVFRDTSEEQAEEDRVKRELDTLAWVGRTRDAIDEDRLTLYSQPIIPLAGGQPSQELLLRMVGKDGEIIPPGSFLPVAEKYGLIGEIDRWVIGKAVRLAASGQRLEANLSAESISNLDLLPLIERELRNAHADPANVVFEITETALMKNVEAGEAFARGLSEIGCQVALDDFGTGFGSFTYLKKLPITYLKIDIDFVRDLLTNRANQHLVKAIVGLARGLRLPDDRRGRRGRARRWPSSRTTASTSPRASTSDVQRRLTPPTADAAQDEERREGRATAALSVAHVHAELQLRHIPANHAVFEIQVHDDRDPRLLFPHATDPAAGPR